MKHIRNAIAPSLAATLAMMAPMLTALLLLSACAGGGPEHGEMQGGALNGGAMQGSGGIAVLHAWVRAAPPNAPATAGFMVITNNGSMDDVLIGVETAIARVSEVHEVVKKDGMMDMHPVDGLPVAKGASVELKPGSYHLMLMNLAHPLVPGERVELTLIFKHAGRVQITAPVQEGPPMSMKH